MVINYNIASLAMLLFAYYTSSCPRKQIQKTMLEIQSETTRLGAYDIIIDRLAIVLARNVFNCMIIVTIVIQYHIFDM